MKNLRPDFPILSKKINGHDLVYLDNSATTQKPKFVIDAISEFYSKFNAPVYRGVYYLAEHATVMFESVRERVAKFIGADKSEIAFTYGATDGINIVAQSWAANNLKSGDSIIISGLEHHSNIVAWQQLAEQKKLDLKVINIDNNGLIDLDNFKQLINSRTKLVSITHISNVLGTHVDIAAISKIAKSFGAKVLVDAAQTPAHKKIDVKALGADFLVFSSHKMFGPDGVGVLYVNSELHDQITPNRVGGGMVFDVDINKTSYLKFPKILEAGSQPVSGVIGLGAAIDYIDNNIDYEQLKIHEASLSKKLIDNLLTIPEIKILGPIEQLKTAGHIVSFVHEKIHPHDMAAYLDKFGICVRAGHHCAQPLHKKLNINGSVRVSFAAYNNTQDVDLLCQALKNISF